MVRVNAAHRTCLASTSAAVSLHQSWGLVLLTRSPCRRKMEHFFSTVREDVWVPRVRGYSCFLWVRILRYSYWKHAPGKSTGCQKARSSMRIRKRCYHLMVG